MKQPTNECIWNIDGIEYNCDKKALEQSGLKERYADFHFIDQGWYSRIYKALDKKECEICAFKVISKKRMAKSIYTRCGEL